MLYLLLNTYIKKTLKNKLFKRIAKKGLCGAWMKEGTDSKMVRVQESSQKCFLGIFFGFSKKEKKLGFEADHTQ